MSRYFPCSSSVNFNSTDFCFSGMRWFHKVTGSEIWKKQEGNQLTLCQNLTRSSIMKLIGFDPKSWYSKIRIKDFVQNPISYKYLLECFPPDMICMICSREHQIGWYSSWVSSCNSLSLYSFIYSIILFRNKYIDLNETELDLGNMDHLNGKYNMN